MSWQEPESGSAEGGEENPDPEEDSDLPDRGLTGDGDRPEDEIVLSGTGANGAATESGTGKNEAGSGTGANVASVDSGTGPNKGLTEEASNLEKLPVENSAESNVCTQSLDGAAANSDRNFSKMDEVGESFSESVIRAGQEKAAAEVNVSDMEAAQLENIVGNGEGAIEVEEERIQNVPEHGDRGPGEASEEHQQTADDTCGSGEVSREEDSFDAAPECESEVRSDSISESDRHLRPSVRDNVVAVETVNNAPAECEEAAAVACDTSNIPATVEHGGDSEQVVEAEVVEVNSNVNFASFTGNVEVSGSVEDAPEDDLENLQAGAGSTVEAPSLPSCPSQAQANHESQGVPDIFTASSNQRHSPDSNVCQDLQTPECDRENLPQPEMSNVVESEENRLVEKTEVSGMSGELVGRSDTCTGVTAAQPSSIPTKQAICDTNLTTNDTQKEAIEVEPSQDNSAPQQTQSSEENGSNSLYSLEPSDDCAHMVNNEVKLEDSASVKPPSSTGVSERVDNADEIRSDTAKDPSSGDTKLLNSTNTANAPISANYSPENVNKTLLCNEKPDHPIIVGERSREGDAPYLQSSNSKTLDHTSDDANNTQKPPGILTPQNVETNAIESETHHMEKTNNSIINQSLPKSTFPQTSPIPISSSPSVDARKDSLESQRKLILGSNSSSNSSLSSMTSQPSNSAAATHRNSPAKAVASALLHVMGMDSKFTGKDLALALQSDDEDDLMSELDAEILSNSASVSSEVKPKQAKSHNKTKTKSSTPAAGGKSESSTSLNEVTPSAKDVQLLQDHNRQLLEQLRIRDEEISRLSKDAQQQSSHGSSSSHSADDLYLPQIKELERTIAQQGTEIKMLTEKLYTHDTTAKRAVISLQNEMKARVDQATKMYEDCRKEKDKMVVKFAEAEAKNMEAKKIMEQSEAKVRDAFRERDNMASGLKAARTDRQKTIASYDAKCAEVSNMHKEMGKMKEAVNSAEYRIKWFQNKLKDELESHKETKNNVEKTNLRLKEAREETELIRKECQAIVKRYQESEEIKSNSLDKELKIKESELQTRLQEQNNTQEIHQMVKEELDSLKAQHTETLQEVKTLTDKIGGLEEERKQNHDMIENYQEIMQKQKADNSELTSKLSSLENLNEDFKRAQTMIETLDKEMADLKVTNRDLQKDMDSCRERESKMLTLQSELSRVNANLRSENTNLSSKVSVSENELEITKSRAQHLDKEVKELSENLESQRVQEKERTEHLVKSLSEKTKESSDFKQKWEDEIDNTKILKRRHANNIKDLTRQLQQAKRRLESLEGKGDNGSMGSRTNSNGSLNSVDASQHHASNNHTQPQSTAPTQEFPVITEQVEVDKNVLIERIVRLQKSHARKNEKLEFLGEHIQQLLEEIKKKTKIIQSYAVREEAGALSSDDMDANKSNGGMQSLLARKGGIMASVYAVHQQDGNMTLDLSLQINKKLQAVLEDTLLKNITLKENLDTLGEEIARLSQENRRLQLHLQDLESKR